MYGSKGILEETIDEIARGPCTWLPIKFHLTAVSRTSLLPQLLLLKGHIMQAYTLQSMEAVNQIFVLHPPLTI